MKFVRESGSVNKQLNSIKNEEKNDRRCMKNKKWIKNKQKYQIKYTYKFNLLRNELTSLIN